MVDVLGDVLYPPHCTTPAASWDMIKLPETFVMWKRIISCLPVLHCKIFDGWSLWNIWGWDTANNPAKTSQHIFAVWVVFAGHSVDSQGCKASSCHQQRLSDFFRCAGWSESLLLVHLLYFCTLPCIMSKCNLSLRMTKPTVWHVHPVKTQIRLGSVQSSLSTWRNIWVFSYPLSALRRLWSDLADAQADLSLPWAHRSFCWFSCEAADLFAFVFHRTLRKQEKRVADLTCWFPLLSTLKHPRNTLWTLRNCLTL